MPLGGVISRYKLFWNSGVLFTLHLMECPNTFLKLIKVITVYYADSKQKLAPEV